MTKDELQKLQHERRKQVLNIGDKVKAISASGKPLYDGKTATIIEKGMIGNDVYYGLYIEGVTVEKRSTPIIGKREIIGNTALLAPYYAGDLQLVERAGTDEPKPKFKFGDKVVVTSSNDYFVPYVGKIVRLEEDSAYITVGYGRIKVPIDRLSPYTEPTAEKERYEPSEIGANAVAVANGVVERLKNGEV